MGPTTANHNVKIQDNKNFDIMQRQWKLSIVFLSFLLFIGGLAKSYGQNSIQEEYPLSDTLTKKNYIKKIKKRFKHIKGEGEEEEEGSEWKKYFNRWKNFAMPRLGNVNSPNLNHKGPRQFLRKKLISNRARRKNSPQTICGNGGGYEPNWELMGPKKKYNDQARGRMVSVAVHPNNNDIIFAGSSHSGLYKTTDNGKTWTNLTDSKRIPGLGIQDIAINPKNPKEIFIATGNSRFSSLGAYGVGLLKSNDGGASWHSTALTNASSNIGVTKEVVINPSNPDVIYASRSDTLFKSTDGGNTFYKIEHFFGGTDTLFGAYKGSINDLALHPNDPSTLYVSTHTPTGYDDNGNKIQQCQYPAHVYRSSNGGNSFQKIDQKLNINSKNIPTIFYLETTPAKPDNLYLRYGMTCGEKCGRTGLAKLTNKGSQLSEQKNFEASYFSTDQFYGPFEVSPTNAQEIYFSNKVIWKSSDGIPSSESELTSLYEYNTTDQGNTHVDTRDITIFESDENSQKNVLIAANDGGISKTNDVGNKWYNHTWENLNGKGLYVTQFYGFAQSEKNADIVYGGTLDNGAYHSNTGKNGFCNDGGGIGDGGDYVVVPNNPKYGFTLSNCGDCNRHLARKKDKGCSPGFSRSKISRWHTPIFTHEESNNFYLTDDGEIEKRHGFFLTTYGYVRKKILNLPTKFDSTYKYLDFLAVAPSDKDVIYAGVNSVTKKPDYRLFKTSDGGKTWSNITYNLGNGNEILYGHVSDIVVDHQDPHQVWLSVAGFAKKKGSKRVYRYNAQATDSSNKWKDISKGLPNVPAIDLAHQANTNDRLYVGTDAGVYTRNKNSNKWKCYNKGLPVAIVTEVDVNHCAGKLRISTWGRGIWEGNLVKDDIEKKVVSADQTWSGEWTLKQSIKIEPGNTLSVRGKLNMPSYGKIQVEKGAKLIVDGGTITNQCNRLWKGIYVWGNDQKTQWTKHGNPHHGKVILKNNAVISNARNAISTTKRNSDFSVDWSHTGGGIIKASNAVFKNNQRCIEFMSFHNPPFTQGGNELPNKSSFNKCKFVVNDDFPMLDYNSDLAKSGVIRMVTMWDVFGVNFEGCEFINKAPEKFPNKKEGGDYKGVGIYSINAGYKVENTCTNCYSNCNNKPSKFKNLSKGIVWKGVGGITPLEVNESKFINVERGVVLRGGNQSQIHDNLFRLNNQLGNGVEPMEPIGLYSIAHGNFVFSQNKFVDKGSGYRSYGMVVNESGENGGNVFRNNFEKLGTGLQVESDDSELRISCNKFKNNGISSSKGADISLIPGYASRWYKSPIFGTCGKSDPHNKFMSPSKTHIRRMPTQWPTAQPRVFYPVSSQNSNPPLNSYLTPQPLIKLCGANSLNSCDDQLVDGCGLPTDPGPIDITAINDKLTTLDGKINLLVPSGNGQVIELIESNNVSTSEKISVLNNGSPYLRDTLLVSAILKATDIPENELAEIMISNSPLTERVIGALNNRQPKLSDAVLSDIMNHQGEGMSPRKDLKKEIKLLRNQINSQIKRKAFYYNHLRLSQDTERLKNTDTNYLEEAISTLKLGSYDFREKSMVANSLLKHDSLQAASEVFNSIDSNFLTSKNYQNYTKYYNFLKSLQTQDNKLFDLSQSQTTTLYTVASRRKGSGLHAKNILGASTDTGYTYYPYEMPTQNAGKRSLKIFPEDEGNEASQNVMKLVPNPARKQVKVKIGKSDLRSSSPKVVLRNMLGKNLKTANFSKGDEVLILDLQGLKPGLYNVTIAKQGKMIDTKRLLVVD